MMPEAQIAQSHSTLEETTETPNKIQGYTAWDMWDTDYMLGDAEEGWDAVHYKATAYCYAGRDERYPSIQSCLERYAQ